MEPDLMKEDHKFLKGALCGALVMLCVISAVGGIRSLSDNFTKPHAISGTDKKGGFPEEKLEVIREVMDEYYLHADDIDEEALIEGICAGYVSGLGDPYSAYYTEEEARELLQGISGEYSGIGAGLSKNNETNAVTITTVYKDSPAEEAGMEEGDILLQVDGHEVTGEDLNQVVAWIKGEEGTQVKLNMLRDSEELELTAVRRMIEVQTVSYEMKDSRIGYIRVSEFDVVTYEQFKDALRALDEQGMEGLVIDLRSNPGGNLTVVMDMLGQILPRGTIVTTENRDGKDEEYYCDGSHEFKKPLAVLVNGYSASASEIFSGAVQDYKKGKIVGTTTYGKGVVQEVLGLSDGSYLKITISEYFLPSGRSIDKVGITPDVEVEYEPDEENPEADNQLDKAMEVVRKEL